MKIPMKYLRNIRKNEKKPRDNSFINTDGGMGALARGEKRIWKTR